MTARQSLRDTSAFADEVVAHLPVRLIATDRRGRITLLGGVVNKFDYLLWTLLIAAVSLGFSRFIKKRVMLRLPIR